MTETFFTSDEHYWHRNICAYADRPFADLREMHEALIERHNAVVKPEDTVYHLGDFAFGAFVEGELILSRLNGIHYIYLGNHDRSGAQMVKMGFKQAAREGSFNFTIEGERVTAWMCHYPYWNPNAKDLRYPGRRPVDAGLWLLHGHVHQAWKINGRQINVGVDVNDYRPIHVDEIASIIARGEDGKQEQT